MPPTWQARLSCETIHYNPNNHLHLSVQFFGGMVKHVHRCADGSGYSPYQHMLVYPKRGIVEVLLSYCFAK